MFSQTIVGGVYLVNWKAPTGLITDAFRVESIRSHFLYKSAEPLQKEFNYVHGQMGAKATLERNLVKNVLEYMDNKGFDNIEPSVLSQIAWKTGNFELLRVTLEKYPETIKTLKFDQNRPGEMAYLRALYDYDLTAFKKLLKEGVKVDTFYKLSTQGIGRDLTFWGWDRHEFTDLLIALGQITESDRSRYYLTPEEVTAAEQTQKGEQEKVAARLSAEGAEADRLAQEALNKKNLVQLISTKQDTLYSILGVQAVGAKYEGFTNQVTPSVKTQTLDLGAWEIQLRSL